MAIRVFMLSFLLASFLLSLLFMPSLLIKSILSIHLAGHIERTTSSPLKSYPVSFAYLISASTGDVDKLKRLLMAIYHPANHYLLHLDGEASPEERSNLTEFVAGRHIFKQTGNVWIIGKPNLVTYRGPTMLSTTLHAMAILLRCCDWDWFINLSASDYPLITQDDLIMAFSKLPRNLSFIHHTNHLGWKLKKRVKPIIIDPGLYSLNKTEIILSEKQRSIPTAFKLFTGSAWTVLGRSFSEYIILGWDNLPRTLLLYYTNLVSSPEGYFQTVICNSNEYQNTVVNNDLHYIMWDNPPKQHPLYLGVKDYRRMILSNVPFARKFKEDDPVLDRIDTDILRRKKDEFAFGGWCSDHESSGCSGSHGRREINTGVLRPGAGSRRLKALLTKLISPRNLKKRQCRLVPGKKQQT